MVGFIGFLVNPGYFKSLSPLNLILSSGLILLMSSNFHWKFFGALIGIAIIGFTLEVIGVKTEVIFGSYRYGNALGIKILTVPLLIGINWAILIYATTQFWQIKNSVLNALFGAFLMVFLDFFIEQNAAKFDFWYWKNNVIPIQNYVAWFIISFLLNLVFQKNINKPSNQTAKAFYVIQILFFGLFYFLH